MAAIAVLLQADKVDNKTGTDGVQMNIPNQLLEIYFLLADDGFETVLKKLTMTAMTPVKADDVTGQQPPHKIGQRHITGPEKKVSMVG